MTFAPLDAGDAGVAEVAGVAEDDEGVAGGAYWVAVATATAVGAGACVLARRRPGRVATAVGRGISLTLAAVAAVYVVRPVVAGGWTAAGSLPLNLCDVALAIAAVACWLPRWRLGVELTYFWGAAGTLQAVLTPDLAQRFPSLEFFEFVVGHVGILVAAAYLVVALRISPRRGAAVRVFAITLAYTAVIGVIDWLSGGDYMYLAHRPRHASLLSALGPWPWYILSAAGVAIVLFWLLDLPFEARRRRRIIGA